MTDYEEYFSFSFAVHAFLSYFNIDKYITADGYEQICEVLNGDSGVVYFVPEDDESDEFRSVCGIYVKKGKKLIPVKLEHTEDEI